MIESLVLVSLLSFRSEPISISMEIDGVSRTGIIYRASSKKAPTVFAFHGHGGTARNSARSFGVQVDWPEANVIYLQGLPTKTGNDPEGKRSGWHNQPSEYGGRDLKFFDAVLDKAIKEEWADPKQIYAMGHSNGGRFTYVLWASRGEMFAAFGPSAAACRGLEALLKPNNVFVVAGTNDQVVPFERQQDSITAIQKILQCSEPVSKSSQGPVVVQSGVNNSEFATMIHDGTHAYPRAATTEMVKFFKRHQKS